MPKRPRYKTPIILSDNPLEGQEQAEFHFDDFAATLARLIADKNTPTPLTIGISGSWGAGKTSLLRRLQHQLNATWVLDQDTVGDILPFANAGESPGQLYRRCRTVWFDAWKYADEEQLLVALVRVIVQEMFKDDWISKLGAAFWEPFTPRRNVIDTVLSWFSIKTPFGEVKGNTGKASPTPLAEKTALLDLFDDVFDRLLAAWVHRKTDLEKIDPHQGVLVVFIDDLDRCLPPKTIQVLEAVKLFLDKKGCVFVIGADVDLIRQAIEVHYKEIQGQQADDYLEKIIQLRFRLPQIDKNDLQKFLSKKPVDDSMKTRWQALVAAAEANPRRVKAVINDLELQWRMLENSAQAEGVNRDDFICWQALMRAAPPGFRLEFDSIPDDPGGLRLRHQFIMQTFHWVCGSAEEKAALTNYYEKIGEHDARRLRGVLREIGSFSDEFTVEALDAYVHLAAPPQKPALPAPPPPAEKTGRPVESETGLPKGAASRGEPPASRFRQFAGQDFCSIPKGDFVMGSTDDNPLAFDDEKPRHTVTIAQDYWLGRYPVTNTQFQAFMQANPTYKTSAEKSGSAYAYDGKEWKDTKGANWQHPRGPKSAIEGKEQHPVVSVSWDDAMAYCAWLNKAYAKDLPAGMQFRLPTEAEWENASRDRRGSHEWPWGSEEPTADRCNFNMNVGDTTPVGQYSPQGDSPYGCADMAGNVWEWTHSIFKSYPYDPLDGREDPKTKDARVVRGGSFFNIHGRVRCAFRYSYSPLFAYVVHFGFRVVVASPISNSGL